MDTNVKNLLEAVERDLGEPGQWTEWPGGWPGEVEVCLVDAIYSANAKYGTAGVDGHGSTGVHRVIDRLRSVRDDTTLDNLESLANTLRQGAPPVLENEQKSPGTSTLKETNALRIAEAFVAAGVVTSADLDRYVEPGDARWPAHPQHGRIMGVAEQTWEYFLMLTGHTGVKADRMICRYVTRAIGVGSITAKEAGQLVRDAAAELPGIKPHTLDHAIWAFESGNQ